MKAVVEITRPTWTSRFLYLGRERYARGARAVRDEEQDPEAFSARRRSRGGFRPSVSSESLAGCPREGCRPPRARRGWRPRRRSRAASAPPAGPSPWLRSPRRALRRLRAAEGRRKPSRTREG